MSMCDYQGKGSWLPGSSSAWGSLSCRCREDNSWSERLCGWKLAWCRFCSPEDWLTQCFQSGIQTGCPRCLWPSLSRTTPMVLMVLQSASCLVAPFGYYFLRNRCSTRWSPRSPSYLSSVGATGSLKELFGFLGDDRVTPIEAFRLRKEPINGKPRLLKVHLSNATQRSAILRKAKLLKGSEKFKEIFVRPSYTAIERIHICGLYDTLRTKKNETGIDHYIYRRGPVSQWSVKMRQVSNETPSQSHA